MDNLDPNYLNIKPFYKKKKRMYLRIYYITGNLKISNLKKKVKKKNCLLVYRLICLLRTNAVFFIVVIYKCSFIYKKFV